MRRLKLLPFSFPNPQSSARYRPRPKAYPSRQRPLPGCTRLVDAGEVVGHEVECHRIGVFAMLMNVAAVAGNREADYFPVSSN